jgi:hypothetical protein
MRKNPITVVAFAFVALFVVSSPACSHAQGSKASYPAMAPLDQYLSVGEKAEIALARSAAPASVSDGADVMVLRRDGYATAVKGSNGFVCIVQRSWANTTDNAEFWNPRMRAPNCFNAPAAATILPYYLMKTKLVLAGKSPADINSTMASTLEKNEFPPLAADTFVYMMSRQQYLNDRGMSWHPHVMFYGAGDAEKTRGANLPSSPIMAGYDGEQRVTTFFVVVPQWSDGTPGPPMQH